MKPIFLVLLLNYINKNIVLEIIYLKLCLKMTIQSKYVATTKLCSVIHKVISRKYNKLSLSFNIITTGCYKLGMIISSLEKLLNRLTNLSSYGKTQLFYCFQNLIF
jgi:Na+-translocating ferredoxin:NAD+ oxidoreductase RnfA subunit